MYMYMYQCVYIHICIVKITAGGVLYSLVFSGQVPNLGYGACQSAQDVDYFAHD